MPHPIIHFEFGASDGGAQSREGVPAYLTMYVAVDDLEQAMVDAERLGGSRLVPPTTVPGIGAFAMLRDPVGNMVGVMAQDAGAAAPGVGRP